MIAVARFIDRDLNSSDSFDSIALLNTYRRTVCRELRAIRARVITLEVRSEMSVCLGCAAISTEFLSTQTCRNLSRYRAPADQLPDNRLIPCEFLFMPEGYFLIPRSAISKNCMVYAPKWQLAVQIKFV